MLLELVELGLELGDPLGERLDVLVDGRPRIHGIRDVLECAADLVIDLLLPLLEPMLGVVDPLA